MHQFVVLNQCKDTEDGTIIYLTVPKEHIAELLVSKRINTAEIRFDDGRTISADQRKKIYATIRDITNYTGYLPEEQKEWLKYLHIERTGSSYFSLSRCSMDTAREFINTILEYALENGIQLSDNGINRTDDIDKYLYYCIKHKKCAVCGRDGEVHHEDAIGMGNNREKLDDSKHRKICLCRIHHTIAHQKGVLQFRESYKVYGIVVDDPVETP